MQPGSYNDLYHRVMYSGVIERTEQMHKEAAHAADVAEAHRYRLSQRPTNHTNLRQKFGYTLINWGQKLSGDSKLVPQEVK